MNSYDLQNTFIVISSSNSDTAQDVSNKKTYVPQEDEEYCIPKGPALAGNKYDVMNLKSKYSQQHYIHTIQSSQHEGIFLPKATILNNLFKYFILAPKNVYIFYTGHGYKITGDWAVQTFQNPKGDRITLQQVVGIWNKHKQSKENKKQSLLYIFMDSCYSGAWCYQLQKIQKLKKLDVKGISVFASCSEKQESTTFNQSGGIFFACIFEKEDKNNKMNYNRLLKTKQHPIFSCEGEEPAFIDRDLIFELQKSIRNTIQFFNAQATICKQHRRIKPGVILEAKCKNKDCKAYNQMVRVNMEDCEGSLPKNMKNSACPLCKQKTDKVEKVSIYKTKIKFEGQKSNEEDEIVKQIEAEGKKVCDIQDITNNSWQYVELRSLKKSS